MQYTNIKSHTVDAFLKQSLHDLMFNQVSSWSLHTSPCKAHSHLVVGGPVLQYSLKAKT